MKEFLAVQRAGAGRLRPSLTLDPASQLLDLYGRVSPVHRVAATDAADDSEKRTGLPKSGLLAFLFPKSPRSALSRLLARGHAGVTTLATPGLASVVLFSSNAESVENILDEVAHELNAVEVWPIVDGVVLEADIQVREWTGEDELTLELDHIPFADLPYEVRTEVEQFNLNLHYFWARAHRYCQEYSDLATWLHEAVTDAVAEISRYATADTDPGSLPDPQQHYGRVSFLVEVNACLTMLNSQAVSVTPPLAQSSFPVGEHSLLGIGSAARAVWQIYRHMSDVFAEAQHLDKLRAMSNGEGFDAGTRPYSMKMDTWSRSPLSIETQAPAESKSLPRRHIVYFSSRWGFHQTLQSVSISWQCINGNAARDWNLLTLSHEFLHAQLREILDEYITVGSAEALRKLVEDFNHPPSNSFGMKTKQFLVQQLRWIDHALQLVEPEHVDDHDDAGAISLFVNQPLSESEALFLIKERLRFLEEVVVHIMDYVYFYNGDDSLYVSSLWHSWALIPNVQPKLDEYVLRTLMALSFTWRDNDSEGAFNDASARLHEEFSAILGEGGHGLIEQARDLLAHESNDPGPRARRNLRTRFLCSFALVRWMKQFAISTQLHANLIRDSQRGAGGHAYPFDPWDFPDSAIESPAGFLLDRYREMLRAHQNDELEAHSLWNLLVLI